MTNSTSIPKLWDDERDVLFFRITAASFSPSYCYGASVLLASYDPDECPRTMTPAHSVPTQPCGPSTAGTWVTHAPASAA